MPPFSLTLKKKACKTDGNSSDGPPRLPSPGRDYEWTWLWKREQVCANMLMWSPQWFISIHISVWIRSPRSTRLFSGAGPSLTHRDGFSGWWVSFIPHKLTNKNIHPWFFCRSWMDLNELKMFKLLRYWDVFSFHLFFSAANNTGSNKRQITDLVDQSIQITTHCFVVTADNRYILVCGFWDKSFRVYSSETGRLQCKLYFLIEVRTDVWRTEGYGGNNTVLSLLTSLGKKGWLYYRTVELTWARGLSQRAPERIWGVTRMRKKGGLFFISFSLWFFSCRSFDPFQAFLK